jgi:hypothetical protein
MVRLPTIVYKAGGKHFSKWGGWSSKGVNTLDEYNKALAEGWHPTQAEAFGLVKKPEPVPEPEPEIDDTSPPSRDELEYKARELGIKFDGRTGDKALLRKISERLEAA